METDKTTCQLILEALLKRALAIVLPVILVALALGLAAAACTAFTPEKAGFQVKFKDETSPYRVIGVFVLPGETVPIEVLPAVGGEETILGALAGETTRQAANKWRWTAPQETGLYRIILARPSRADSITLNVFVMVPFEELKGEYLRGYRIGKYPTTPLKQMPIYRPPVGFIEVTAENEETLVSPHFSLKQFTCKQEGCKPRYLVLTERLLLNLELVLEKTNEKGYHAETFEVMSGYRTPHYNKVIGNVKYSRHLWGGAADIFIDERPRDGMMDDLNCDGKSDYQDAAILYDIVDEMYGEPWYEPFVGGLGRYTRTSSHGPFVHIDVRGSRARWGD